MRDLENIHKILREVLQENEEASEVEKEPEPKESKPKSSKNAGTISTKGAFGSGGRPQKFISNLKSRARSPKTAPGLLRDLGINSRPSGDVISKVLDVINQGIHGNELLSQAYLGAIKKNSAMDTTGERISEDVVEVTVSGIDKKNGVRFLAEMLNACIVSDFITLDSGVQFVQGSGNTILLKQF